MELNDGIPDNRDHDDDGDGIADEFDTHIGIVLST